MLRAAGKPGRSPAAFPRFIGKVAAAHRGFVVIEMEVGDHGTPTISRMWG